MTNGLAPLKSGRDLWTNSGVCKDAARRSSLPHGGSAELDIETLLGNQSGLEGMSAAYGVVVVQENVSNTWSLGFILNKRIKFRQVICNYNRGLHEQMDMPAQRVPITVEPTASTVADPDVHEGVRNEEFHHVVKQPSMPKRPKTESQNPQISQWARK